VRIPPGDPDRPPGDASLGVDGGRLQGRSLQGRETVEAAVVPEEGVLSALGIDVHPGHLPYIICRKRPRENGVRRINGVKISLALDGADGEQRRGGR